MVMQVLLGPPVLDLLLAGLALLHKIQHQNERPGMHLFFITTNITRPSFVSAKRDSPSFQASTGDLTMLRGGNF